MCRLVCPHGCRGGRCPLLPRGILKPAASGQRSRTQGPTAAHALHFHAPLAPRRGVAAPLRCKISRLDAAMGLRRTPQLCHRRSAFVARGKDSDGSREARAPVVMAAAAWEHGSREGATFFKSGALCPLPARCTKTRHTLADLRFPCHLVCVLRSALPATTCTSRRSSTRPTPPATQTTRACQSRGAPADTFSTWTASSAGSRHARRARCATRSGSSPRVSGRTVARLQQVRGERT